MRLSESKSPGEWAEYCEQQRQLRASRKRAADAELAKQEIIASFRAHPSGIAL